MYSDATSPTAGGSEDGTPGQIPALGPIRLIIQDL